MDEQDRTPDLPTMGPAAMWLRNALEDDPEARRAVALYLSTAGSEQPSKIVEDVLQPAFDEDPMIALDVLADAGMLSQSCRQRVIWEVTS